jgi:mannose-6-phosphate isomerase-like protein (cupin superfamily)
MKNHAVPPDQGPAAEKSAHDDSETSSEEGWRVFDLHSVIEKAAAANSPYREFLRVPALSCGVYRLKVGARDLQGPHDEDEVYYVLEGRARMRVGEREISVEPGSVLYVSATEEHSFFEIVEDMTLLVFFATGGPGGE